MIAGRRTSPVTITIPATGLTVGVVVVGWLFRLVEDPAVNVDAGPCVSEPVEPEFNASGARIPGSITSNMPASKPSVRVIPTLDFPLSLNASGSSLFFSE